MLEIKICFESSWSNSFFTAPGGKPLFTSGSQLSSSVKPKGGLKPVMFDLVTASKNRSRLSYLQSLQLANPELLYRVPVSFDRALQGVLARLVGEVRRLSDIEDDHLAYRAFAAIEHDVHIEHEHSQTTKLSTYEINKIQTGGAGLITNDVIYSKSDISRNLFGHLGQSLVNIEFCLADVLEAGALSSNLGWFPASPSALIERLNVLLEDQSSVIKTARSEIAKGQYVSPYANVLTALAKVLPDEAKDTIDNQKALHALDPTIGVTIEAGALDGWSIAGATIVARIKLLTPQERLDYIKTGALTERGNLKGLAMTSKKSLGNITDKDLFSFASGVSAVSSSIPYGLSIPVFLRDGTRQDVPSGVLKKTGTITFRLNENPELELELEAAIEAASVGPFHFGKKGVAYVQSLECY